MTIDNQSARAGDGKTAQDWEGADEWMPLAWELCANEHGEEACTELIWEGGPIPEPWGDRWLKYEDQAKEMIAMVRKHVPAAALAEMSEERRQLQHLVDDIVEEADQDGHTYYRVRDGADVLFSNMVGACARLLAQPAAAPAAAPGEEAAAGWEMGDWQQYAKEGETAQACIERHRGEHDSLLALLAQARTELGRAYRCIQGMHNALVLGIRFAALAYHGPTIAAAKRYVFEDALDGSEYFIGKPVEVLHAALALPAEVQAPATGEQL